MPALAYRYGTTQVTHEPRAVTTWLILKTPRLEDNRAKPWKDKPRSDEWPLLDSVVGNSGNTYKTDSRNTSLALGIQTLVTRQAVEHINRRLIRLPHENCRFQRR